MADNQFNLRVARMHVVTIQRCIHALDQCVVSAIPQNDERVKKEYNRLKETLYANLNALDKALIKASGASSLSEEDFADDLQRLIEEELVFFPIENRMRFPDKVTDAICLIDEYGDHAELSDQQKTYIDRVIMGSLIGPLLDEIKNKYRKNLAFLSLDMMESMKILQRAPLLRIRAKDLALGVIREHGGRPNPNIVRERGQDEFDAVFDEPVSAAEASVILARRASELIEPSTKTKIPVKFRIGLHWERDVIERNGHCPEETPAKAVVKRLRDLEPQYRTRSLIYCSNDFQEELKKQLPLTLKSLTIDFGHLMHKHIGRFPLKKHEKPMQEVWEVLWSERTRPHCPPGVADGKTKHTRSSILIAGGKRSQVKPALELRGRG